MSARYVVQVANYDGIYIEVPCLDFDDALRVVALMTREHPEHPIEILDHERPLTDDEWDALVAVRYPDRVSR